MWITHSIYLIFTSLLKNILIKNNIVKNILIKNSIGKKLSLIKYKNKEKLIYNILFNFLNNKNINYNIQSAKIINNMRY